MSCDGAEDVIIAVNSTKNLNTTSNPANSLSLPGGVLCAKASMLLQVSYETQMRKYVDLWEINKPSPIAWSYSLSRLPHTHTHTHTHTHIYIYVYLAMSSYLFI